MTEHINVESDWKSVPDYCVHDENNVKGFFGKYRYLSNFHTCPAIWYMGNRFPSVENAYQASKFDMSYQSGFVDVSASLSKKLAKEMVKEGASRFTKEQWDLVKLYIMAELVFQKFTYSIELKQKLLDTDVRNLEETNSWHDYYWGVCDGQGQNQLGNILMRTRTFWK